MVRLSDIQLDPKRNSRRIEFSANKHPTVKSKSVGSKVTPKKSIKKLARPVRPQAKSLGSVRSNPLRRRRR